MATLNITDNRPDGTQFGSSAGDKIAFHGATPCSAVDFVNSAGSVGSAVVQPISSSSGFTFANSSAGQRIITLVETMRTALIAKGIMKSS